MVYRQEAAASAIHRYVRSYWTVDSEGDGQIRREKIIPDGFPEIIIHYGDPYKILLGGQWKLQEKELLAGQIRNHFYLENTGISGVFGIKLQPWTLKYLFNLNMKTIRDKVIMIPYDIRMKSRPLLDICGAGTPFEQKIQELNDWWMDFLGLHRKRGLAGEKAAQLILDRNGAVGLEELLQAAHVSERSLGRYFDTHIGLGPKFYSRIIRFSHIFKLVQQPDFQWADISFLAGYYDQSHFIKNFKEFTGEEPSRYAFDKANMANLFLR